MHKSNINSSINPNINSNKNNSISGKYYDNIKIFIDNFIENYLVNVSFIDNDLHIKKNLMKDIIKIYIRCYKNINNIVKSLINSNKNNANKEKSSNTNEWKKCCNKCYTILHRCIKKELNTTAFILKTIADSIITTKGSPKNLVLSVKKLTGNWENDKNNITIISYGTISLNDDNIGKLIISTGPSASGKTYWTNNIIELFGKLVNFPKSFISIDGGIYRTTSLIYNIIHEIFIL